MQSRFAKFRNVPELLRMWHLSADIKTAADLQLPTPALVGGQAETVVVAPSADLVTMMAELSERADRVQSRQVDPAQDNMLRIATHGRMAALDLRLLGREPGEPTKLVAAAGRIAAIHHRTAGRTYQGSTVPGSLQLVFSDLGTPREGWNVYDELRTLLVERGVPAARIAFVHSARNDREKGELFAACRAGQVGVLLGSTERMGVGTNVQARAVALHHLDCPWRPADLAQREGRILRQGNFNSTVEIVRYVSEGSFDAYLWQTVERKARFIGQVMRGTLDVREIEDIGETALSYSEVKALATGDPRILDKARADADSARLERLERAHTRTAQHLRGTLRGAEQRMPVLQRDLELAGRAAATAVDIRGDRFGLRLGERMHTRRPEAAAALREALLALPPAPSSGRPAAPAVVAELAGLRVLATAGRHPEPHLRLELADVPRSSLTVELTELRTARPTGLLTRLENRAGAIGAVHTEIGQEIDRLRAEHDRAQAELDRPFGHHQALAEARLRSARLTSELSSPDHRGPTRPGPAVPAPASPAAGVRWYAQCLDVDRRLVDDPHWPALAAALDRAAATGLDVPATLGALTREQLPDAHPARTLHYLLVAECDAAITPPPPAAGLRAAPAAPAASVTAARQPARASPRPPQPRR
jgi:hypothetical protein